jgi:hypothetical protein
MSRLETAFDIKMSLTFQINFSYLFFFKQKFRPKFALSGRQSAVAFAL